VVLELPLSADRYLYLTEVEEAAEVEELEDRRFSRGGSCSS
jgi:hypothetical protein